MPAHPDWAPQHIRKREFRQRAGRPIGAQLPYRLVFVNRLPRIIVISSFWPDSRQEQAGRAERGVARPFDQVHDRASRLHDLLQKRTKAGTPAVGNHLRVQPQAGRVAAGAPCDFASDQPHLEMPVDGVDQHQVGQQPRNLERRVEIGATRRAAIALGLCQ